MADAPDPREQRLAAKLRENLRRRKEQARARAAGTATGGKPQADSEQSLETPNRDPSDGEPDSES